MSNIKCVLRNIESLFDAEVKEFGHSMLEGIMGEVVDENNGKKPEMKACGNYDENAIAVCTTAEECGRHIDIFAEPVRITYDLGEEKKVENIIIRCFFNSFTNYSLGEFELYGASSCDELYQDENKIAHIKGIDSWHTGGRNNADWLFDIEGSFRYFGIRILKANGTDDITRLGFVGVYNQTYTENKKYIINNFPRNILSNLEPRVITNGDLQNGIKIAGQETFSLKLNEARSVDNIWIMTDDECDVAISPAPDRMELSKNDKYEYRFFIDEPQRVEDITVTVKGNTTLYLLGATSNKATASVDFQKVITDDFMGVGVNVLPMSFMPESIANGYNEVYWNLERSRILKTRPHVARLWFQPDWLVETYEEYKGGNYNFDAPKMYSVYKYLDAFKEAGTEIEFNFGWKVSSHAQEWFSFEGTPTKNNSAPRELDLFSKCCAATLVELINNRGYDNIKYLTFYNEPDYGANRPDYGDFVVIGCDRKEYWERMLRLTREALDKNGLDYIKMWGCECSGGADIMADWMDYFNENCSDVLDVHTIHIYAVSFERGETYLPDRVRHAAGKPIVLSECGQYGERNVTWKQNHVQLFSQIANHGFNGMLLWCLNSMAITDPCSFLMSNDIDMWGVPYAPGGVNNVNECFYELAMLCRYVPNHCKTVSTKITEGYNDVRVSAFKIGDDYTVVVEIAGNTEKIEIDLGESINKKFYKHLHRRPHNSNGNAVIPPVCGEVFVESKLCDTLNPEYSAIVYTTLPPVVQVEAGATEVYVEAGESTQLSAAVVDGIGQIDWSLSTATSEEFTFTPANQIVKVSENAKSGDMCAITARSCKHPEAESVIIVKVK